MMKIRPISFVVAAILAGASASGYAAENLLARSSSDQIPSRLVAANTNKVDNAQLDRAASSMSWALDPQVALDARPTAHVAESREYWIDATGDELQRGVNLSTTAKGALIRISPHADNHSRLDASSLGIAASGKRYASADAISAAADEDALRAAGMDAPQGSLVVKLKDSVGAGTIELTASNAQGKYLIHVFEPASPVVLNLQATTDTVIAGESIRFVAQVAGGAKLERISGLISSPNGHSQSVDFVRQRDGSYVANARPDTAHAGGHGLWEVHAFGVATFNKQDVQRDARTAFAVSTPTARLDGSIKNQRAALGKSADKTISLGVETASASRYQLAGVLYGTAADGTLRPAVVAHSAKWLDAGSGTIDLRFDAAEIAKAGVKAPFELRDLRLINQADMSLIERRERAAVLN
jgi:hypothetical protein